VRPDWLGQRYPGARLPGTSRQASRRSPTRTRGRRVSCSPCLERRDRRTPRARGSLRSEPPLPRDDQARRAVATRPAVWQL